MAREKKVQDFSKDPFAASETVESEDFGAGADFDSSRSSAPKSLTYVTEKARAYRGDQTVDHDLFKLEAATMRKNMSYTEIPDYHEFEHCHIFHTVDSSGRVQAVSTSVGGHFHEVEVQQTTHGVPSIKIGEPKRWVRKTVDGRLRRVTESIPNDSHMHRVKYLGSERIQIRTANAEFAKFEMQIKAKQEPRLDGVQG